jgi:NAD(P)-dependent dehydrogenase (short-subunit alcohol dehydrogenase family)
MSSDLRLREMTSDPSDAHVLVTDGGSALGQALVRALAAAGAARIWVGLGKPLAAGEVPARLRGVPQITCLHLDVTDRSCVRDAAAAIGNELDILINTTDVSQARAATEGSLDLARAEMEAHYFGLLQLAQHFVPCLTARAARTQRLSPAWVNVLSLSALSNAPAYLPQQTVGAAMAAAHAFSQGMRVQMRQEGARLVTVFPGPLDNESNQGLQQPKLAIPVLAQSILAALRNGVEEVYPGEVAREWLEERLSAAHGT